MDYSYKCSGFIGSSSSSSDAGFLPGLRLSLASNTPITTTDVSSAATLYYTPYLNGNISLYINSAWTFKTISEISLALSITSGKNYDVFAYWNGSAVALELSAAWTTDIARADATTR